MLLWVLRGVSHHHDWRFIETISGGKSWKMYTSVEEKMKFGGNGSEIESWLKWGRKFSSENRVKVFSIILLVTSYTYSVRKMFITWHDDEIYEERHEL
jgi:hypothetical protein